jgi:hypothetical protein
VRDASSVAGGRTPSVRGKSRHIGARSVAMFWLAATFTSMSGCASDRVVRCNGKLEPINAAAVVPAMNLGVAGSEQIRRSESQ